MTDAKRKMHLAIQAAAPGHPAGWRVPGGERQAGDDVAHYQNVARICERALLDVLFLADSPSFTDDGRSPTRSLDPVVLITACALATEHLGLVLTASTTFSQPYNLARSILTLDQVSRGRVGWNIVTTADAVASLNFGMTEMPSSDLRYEMAADFTAAVRALWDSWDDGALVGDVDTGVWADINRIHAVNYAGRHYTTAGPMQVWRSPQGQPVLVQAGSSPQGHRILVKGQKNDYNDAEAIAEAALRPNLHFVQEKSQDQLDLQACHRVRSRLVSRRTATINQIRAFLIEQGIAVRSGLRTLRKSLFAILENRKDEISPRTAKLILGLYGDWCGLDERIEAVTSEIEELSQVEAKCQRLMSVPGIGPIISTGIVAAIGTGEAFERGRDFGAWLGLVPRQHSTGGRSVLGRISKRGSKYLRTLLIQAAKVLLMRPHNWSRYSFGAWLTTAAERLHRNKLAVALANKLARIAWSVLRHDKAFDTHLEAVAI